MSEETYYCEAATVVGRATLRKCGNPTTKLMTPLNIAVCDICAKLMKCKASVWYDHDHLTGGEKYRYCGNDLPCKDHP